MVYTKREDLSIIELTEERDMLTYDELIPLLMKRTSNVIYVELRGILYGIVTMGRISRTLSAETRRVAINKNFTAVCVGQNTYINSRRLFKENDTVSFVPVVDLDGKLHGEWASRSDLSIKNYIASIADNPQIAESLRGRKVTLVKPGSGFEADRQLFLFYKQLFESNGVLLTIVDFADAERCIIETRGVSIPVFINRIEENCVRCCISMSHAGDPSFGILNLMDCQYLINTAGGNKLHELHGVETVFHSLETQGITVLAFDFAENEHGYLEEFCNRIQEKYRRYDLPVNSQLYPQMRREFLCELYEKLEGLELPLRTTVALGKDGIFSWRDTNTPFLHVSEGKRQTVGQPERYDRCIYVVGPCMVAGTYVEDQYTLPSLLQKEVNQKGFSCKVVNLGMGGELTVVRLQVIKIIREDLREGDIVVFDANGLTFQEIPVLNVTDELEKNHVPVEWVTNSVRHCNHKVSQICAKAICEQLMPVLRQPVKNRQLIAKDVDVIKSLYIDRFFSDFDGSSYEKIGSIVMNCNPFTFGHRYLIEYAASQVDALIIFVVEEDASLFTFEERFAMVCEGTADLRNVKVVPSGDFILSKRTFPEYFDKEVDEDIVENTENDITLFAEKIAPVLGITHRFVGEEPEDEVTNAYNQAMKRILPAYGIQLVEILRKRDEMAVISASRVRRCLEENELEKLEKLIPESTKKIIFYVNERSR